jgi:hypothetical protein
MEITSPKMIVQAVSRETLRRAHLSMALERYDELRCIKQMEYWRESARSEVEFDGISLATELGSSRFKALEVAIKEIEEALGLDGLMP